MFKNILVSTDGSISGGNAVRIAAGLAKQFDAELTVLHVLMHGEPPEALKHMAEVEHLAEHHPNPNTGNAPLSTVTIPSDNDAARFGHEVIERIGQRIVESATAQARGLGAPAVAGETAEGDAANKIIDTADRVGADLLVIGSRGLGRLTGLLMGSVSQKVSQLSECPCLIVK